MFDSQIGKWRLHFRRFRWYGVAVCCALVILGLNSIAVSQQPITIKVLMSALEATQWQPLVEKFEAQNPDIDLEIIEGPNATNLVEDLYTSSFLLGNSPYDLVYMDIVWTPKFAAAGWLMELSDRISEAQSQDFLAGDLNGGRYQGELYRIPFRSDAGMLYYRQDLLSAAERKPPETTEELIEISQELQAENKIDWGYVWQGKQYEGLAAMFVEILKGFGGFWIDPNTQEVGLDRPEAIAAVSFLRETIESGISPSGVTTYQEEETRRFFQNGKALFLRNWPYVWALANAEDSPVKGKIGLKPMVYAPGHESAACQGGWGLGISKTTQHPDEAWRVIEFITSAATQKKFILETGYVPSRRSLFTDQEIVAKYGHYPQLLEVQESSVLRPPIAQYAQASDILQRYLSAALTDRMTPEKAMAGAATETRNLLGR
ncbi:MAG TPA: ABC transporter substrate-binding protein [Oscillatoriales cyanobacterium M59_W2019_021]|nr:MAG: ABC transporter substrate-binding protein [Cyanobacteria bacterium J055]HIK32600.1 ABC transporter substrate-binding protein [Oscillatoriales cyanobacterium M4454_W2019_049]HIK50649.1 ABC transporter substrate-binding protein [Oscillatoriales cyanobacterium M59_W2019_021]